MTDTSGSAGYSMDYQSFEVRHRDGSRWPLRKMQFTIYAILDAHRGEPITSARLASILYPREIGGDDKIRHHIKKMRNHIRNDVIETVKLRGYMIAKEAHA